MKIQELQNQAERIYSLGTQMQETFSKTGQKEYMIIAIMAGLQEVSNKHLPEIISGVFFKTLRDEAGYTLRQVEDSAGISSAYLSQLENDKIASPSYPTVIKLLKFYKFI